MRKEKKRRKNGINITHLLSEHFNNYQMDINIARSWLDVKFNDKMFLPCSYF